MNTDRDIGELLESAGKPPAKVTEAAPVPASGGMIARSYDAWGPPSVWLDRLALNDDKVLLEEGNALDLKLFAAVLDDPAAYAAFQQRRLNVIQKPWTVEPGADDAQSVKAADHLRGQLAELAWDDICNKMLYAPWYGYGVGELIYQIGRDGLLEIADVYVPDRAWFAYRNNGQLVLRTPEGIDGEPVPERKFWTVRTGGSHDAALYGVGLAHWCYWPVWFKKNVIKFWAVYLEKFGMPTLLGSFEPGTSTEDQNKLLQAVTAAGRDSAIIKPKDQDITTLEATRGGSGSSSYAEFVDRMDAEITRIILSQTMTSTAAAGGIGSNQAEVHERVGDAVAQSDSDMLHERFNSGPSKWLTEWNFPGAALPRVYRQIESQDDADTSAERDAKLHQLGWERTDESFAETYGEGYQRVAKAEPVALPAAVPGQAANDDDAQRRAAFALQFAAHDAKPLYIQRKLLNGADLLAWARGQGFTILEDQGDLHCTVLYCRQPVDWFKLAGEACWASEKVEIAPGGPRVVERLGPKGAIVLQFSGPELEWRHRDLIREGAQHGQPNYWPHVTFSYDADNVQGLDLEAIKPYRGKLVFGPEIWEELDGEGSPMPVSAVPTVTFSADDLDAIDRIAATVAATGQAAVTALVGPARDAIAALGDAATPQAIRLALLTAFEAMPLDQVALALADPLVAVRAAEEAGLGADAVA